MRLRGFAFALALLAGSASAAAPATQIKGRWQQGEMLIGQVAPGSVVQFKGKAIRVSPMGRFVIGLDRDEAAKVELSIKEPGAAAQKQTHAVTQRKYDIQRLDGLPLSKVNPPADVLSRIEREAVKIKAARMVDSERDDFADAFLWPAQGRISGVYGSQRILNGEAKQPHYGVDVAVPTGTVIRAPAGGVISLAEPDLYYTGGTLMIDHGHGVVSAFLHLSKLTVQLGDEVKASQPIALSGATGRVTGPHLDWRISWFDARIDPQRLVPPMPAAGPHKTAKESKAK